MGKLRFAVLSLVLAGSMAVPAGLVHASGEDDDKKACCIVCDDEQSNSWDQTCIEVDHEGQCDPDVAAVRAACTGAFGNTWFPDEAMFAPTKRCATELSPPECRDKCSEDPDLEYGDLVYNHEISAEGPVYEVGIKMGFEHHETECQNSDCKCCKEATGTVELGASIKVKPGIVRPKTFAIEGSVEGDSLWCAADKCEEPTAPKLTCDDENYCESEKRTVTVKGTATLPVWQLKFGIGKAELFLVGGADISWGDTETDGSNTCGGCCADGSSATSSFGGGGVRISGRGRLKVGWGWFSYTIDVEGARGCARYTHTASSPCGGGGDSEHSFAGYLGLACEFSGTPGVGEGPYESGGDTHVNSDHCVGASWNVLCFQGKANDGSCYFDIGDPGSC